MVAMTGSLLAIVPARDGCLGGLDQLGNDGFERRRALHRRPTLILELDPTLVEAVEHANSRQRVTRALGAEQRLPTLAGHALDPDGAAEHGGKGLGEIVRRDAGEALQFDDARAVPIFQQQGGGGAPHVLGRDHRHGLARRLQEAVLHALIARSGDI
jgi:hypothetical protein